MLKVIGFEGRVQRQRLVMEGRIQPTALSTEYLVKIEHRADGSPNVWVLDPPIRGREDGTRVPHVYRDPDGSERPCVYHPRKGEWKPTDPIAKTIVPWLLAWLFFYEDWLTTGEWRGGGEHPTGTGKTRHREVTANARRRRRGRRR